MGGYYRVICSDLSHCPSCHADILSGQSIINYATNRSTGMVLKPPSNGASPPTNTPITVPIQLGGVCVSYPGEGTHECTDCESRPARKPIAHKDALDEPVGHLCLFCYSEWMRKVPEDSACAICGDDSAYYSVREVTDLDQETILTTGNIGFCEMHAHECENLQTKIIAK